MKETMYITFMAEDLTEEEVERFRRDWDRIGFENMTFILETSTEGDPPFHARAVHIPQEQSSQAIASFRDGKLHELGWSKVFRLLPKLTPESNLQDNRFRQTRRPEFLETTLIDPNT